MFSLLLLFSMPVQADSFIREVGPSTELESAGTWARAIPMEDGWRIAYASGSAYMLADLVNESGDLDGWLIDKSNQIRLTPEDFTLLKDHAIKRCPDGTYLHTASANISTQNDSAYAWRYDENFEVIGHSIIELETPERAHNDMASICSHLAQGVAFPSTGYGDEENLFFYLDENAAPSGTLSLPGEPRMSGGAFLTDVHENLIYSIGFGLYTRDMYVLTYDENFEQIDQSQVAVLEGYRSYWPQGFLQVGDYFLVALMGAEDTNPDGGGRPDPPNPSSDAGNVWLLVLDRDWNKLEEIQLTYHEPHLAGMRPWLARMGDQVLMTYDAMTEHSVVEIRLNIEAFGLTENSPDTGVNPDFIPYYYGDDDTGEASGNGSENACGNCSTTSAGSLVPWTLGLLGFVAFRRRERR